MPDKIVRAMNQNHKKTKIFSFTMLSGKTLMMVELRKRKISKNWCGFDFDDSTYQSPEQPQSKRCRKKEKMFCIRNEFETKTENSIKLTIELLNAPWGAIFMECAFGHFGENPRHWIATFFWLHLSEAQHIAAIGGKFTTQEIIHEVYLHKDVDEVESLADEEAESIKIVSVEVLAEVIQENLFPFFFRLIIDDGTVEI